MPLEDPLVSVLVPAYNEAATIVEVLEAVIEFVRFTTDGRPISRRRSRACWSYTTT